MKKFMLRHKHNWLPNKLCYGETYWIGLIAVSHEGFTFMPSKNSSHVVLKDNEGEMIVSKRELRNYFKDGLLQFAVKIIPDDDC